MIKSEENVDIRQLLQTAINCSVVKPRKIEQHFDLPEQSLSSISDKLVSDEDLIKQILGFILSCSTAKYGISKKKKTPNGCPHLEIWNDLTSGAGFYDEYAEIFTFLNQCPIKKKTKPVIKPKEKVVDGKGLVYKSQQERQRRVEQEQQRVQYNREMERLSWLQESREKRAQIRWSLTKEEMRSIYIKARKESKMTIDKLCIKANTSRYAIEAIEKGTFFDTYTAAKLFFFIKTNRNIDDSEYWHNPIEVFVDFLAGLKFRYRNNPPTQSYKVDNPKACNLPIYLKK